MNRDIFEAELKNFQAQADVCEDVESLKRLVSATLSFSKTALDESEEWVLAQAICNFADWQTTGYTWTEESRRTINDQLWFEVSNLVESAISERPANPCPRT